MATSTAKRQITRAISASRAGSSLGRLVRRVDAERRSLVIVEGGRPAAVLLNIRDYVKLAAPEPEILRLIGAEAEQNRTSALTSRQIDKAIKQTRADKKKG